MRIEAAAAASGQECRAVLADITEHKRAEADRLILNKLESTGILAAGIAHDFNNLLTVILLNLELAQTLIPPERGVGTAFGGGEAGRLDVRRPDPAAPHFCQGRRAGPKADPPIRQ